MHEFKIDFVKNLKKYLVISGVVFLAGIVMAFVFGIDMDITFKGGTRITYTYTGEIAFDDAEAAIEEALDSKVEMTQSTDITGESTKLVVSLAGTESISSETLQATTKALQEKFPDNDINLGESNSVDPTIASSFFSKSIFAVLLAAVLVIAYIGIRFRKIGGVSAGVMAFVALVHDCLIAFFACVVFRLQIDTNFIAVILTILGYSLNDTIVIYDRIRENKTFNPRMQTRELVNGSINQTLNRSLMTSAATFLAIITVVIVAELFGLTTLRTFAIPMAIGIISGCYSTVCLSGPLWVRWIEYQEKKGPKKKKKK